MENKEKGAKHGRYPEIHIENTGTLTKVYVNGEELDGVRKVEFLHSGDENNRIPILRIELLTDCTCIDTYQPPELPEMYSGFYVSEHKLVEAGILTCDQLNELREKGVL